MTPAERAAKIEEALTRISNMEASSPMDMVGAYYEIKRGALAALAVVPEAEDRARVSAWCGSDGKECQECGRPCNRAEARGPACPGCGWTDEQQARFEERLNPAPPTKEEMT